MAKEVKTTPPTRMMEENPGRGLMLWPIVSLI